LAAYKIAIVGAGPAGYFTAQALQNAQTDELTFTIDMIERLPTPWGLVRSGVAPEQKLVYFKGQYCVPINTRSKSDASQPLDTKFTKAGDGMLSRAVLD